MDAATPWSVEEHSACFIVHDPDWQSVGYFYFEQSTGDSLTRDEARRMAVNFAKLPKLLQIDTAA
jgi:hypothetical protein